MTPEQAHLLEKQIEAAKQGEAYSSALDLMKTVTHSHAEGEVEDYKITVMTEEAEGMYMPQPGGDLYWQIPAEDENLHIEIAVQDRTDLRFVPNLLVQAVLEDEEGNVVDHRDQLFLWHPVLHHYGSNWCIPAEGNYNLHVTILAPEFGRHDEDKGKRYLHSIETSFGDLHCKPGRKEYGPE